MITVWLLCFAALLPLSLLSRNLILLKFKNSFYCVFAVVLGILVHGRNGQQPFLRNFEGKQEIVFKLSKKLNSNEKNRRYETVLILNSKELSAVASVPKSYEELNFNRYYKAETYINLVSAPQNDYQFDYQKYLSRKGIHYQIYLADGFSSAQRNDESFSEIVSQNRLEVLQKIDRSQLTAKTREFLKGIILADRTEMDSATVSDFSKTGLAHILAISGSHIAVIFFIIYFICTSVFPRKYRMAAIVSSLLFIWGFAAFIGFGNSVVRACVMLTVYHIFLLLQRKADFLHSMALAAFFILLIDSQQIFDVGFQLSFAAVFGIFWLNQPLLKLFPKTKSKTQRFMMNILTVSLAAQISTLPLVLYYFHQFSFISIIANLIIIPLAEVVIVFSLQMVVLIAAGFDMAFLNGIFSFTVENLLTLIHWFSTFDSVFFQNIPMHWLEAILAFLMVYFLRFVVKKPALKSFLNFGMALMFFFALRVSLNYVESERNEVMVHRFFRENVVSSKQRTAVTFWIKEGSSLEKIEKYIINPYVTDRRADDVTIKYFPADAKYIEISGKTFDVTPSKVAFK